MKNRDKYAQEMLDIVFSDNNIAISLKDNRPVKCLNFECDDCLRNVQGYNFNCSVKKLCKWAEEEYQEPIKLTPEQVQELEYYHAHGCTHVIIPAEAATESLLLIRSNNKPCSAWSICKYPQLEKLKNYDIQKLLEDNKNEE